MGHRGKQSKRTRLLHSRSSVQPALRAVWLRGSRMLHLLVQSQELHERERKAIFRVPSSHCTLLCIMPRAAPISVAMPLDRGWGGGRHTPALAERHRGCPHWFRFAFPICGPRVSPGGELATRSWQDAARAGGGSRPLSTCKP